MNTPLSQSPYIREQRQFPFEDIQTLARQVDQAYIDIANKINARTIGTFAVNVQVITGEQWYLTGQPQKQQTLRQVYVITNMVGVTHNIPNYANIPYFTRMYGQYTDGTNWYGMFAASSVAIAGQITFNLTPTFINFSIGAGAPSFSKGIIVLEWLSQF